MCPGNFGRRLRAIGPELGPGIRQKRCPLNGLVNCAVLHRTVVDQMPGIEVNASNGEQK